MPVDRSLPRRGLSVVVPCFNEESSLPRLLRTLQPLLQKHVGRNWELVLVDDGSTDGTSRLIQRAHAKNPRVKGIFLSRNFGHQAALFSGLQFARLGFVGILDADLQDPPEVLLSCLQKAQRENLDVVYAVRQRRKAPFFLKFAYWAFYRVISKLAEHTWPLDAGDFSIFSQRACQVILRFPEHVRVFRGLRSWIGLRQGSVAYERPDRRLGKSKYTLFKLGALAMSAIISFSSLPLRLASIIGLGMSVASLFMVGVVLANRFIPNLNLFGYYVGQNPGTTTLAILILSLGSLLFLSLGILGEYMVVIVKEIKARPTAIIKASVGLKNERVRSPHIYSFVDA